MSGQRSYWRERATRTVEKDYWKLDSDTKQRSTGKLDYWKLNFCAWSDMPADEARKLESSL